jgi:hypothetical protein
MQRNGSSTHSVVLPRKKLTRRHNHRTKRRFYRAFLYTFFPSLLIFLAVFFFLSRGDSRLISPIPYLAKTFQLPGGNSDEVVRETETLLQQKQLTYTTIAPAGDRILVTIPDNGEVTLSSKKNLNQQISSLQVIKLRLTMEGKRFSRLDLRFDKPVIVLHE